MPDLSYPYKFTCFYDYDKDCSPTTDFQSSSNQTLGGVCSMPISYTYSHNGSGTFPAAGDEVFDENDDPVLSGYYKFNSTFVYKATFGTVDASWPQDLC